MKRLVEDCDRSKVVNVRCDGKRSVALKCGELADAGLGQNTVQDDSTCWIAAGQWQRIELILNAPRPA